MKRKNMNAFLACLFLFSGCDIIDYHPYDVRIKGETDINAKNIEKIEATVKTKLPSGSLLWEIRNVGMMKRKSA